MRQAACQVSEVLLGGSDTVMARWSASVAPEVKTISVSALASIRERSRPTSRARCWTPRRLGN